MRIARNTRIGRGVATWSGLAVSAAALVAMVAHSAVADPAAQRREHAASAAAGQLCEPDQSAARVTGPGQRDPGALSPEEAAELDRQLQSAAVAQRAPSADRPQTVPVAFHVISDSRGTGNTPADVVDEQIRVLNTAFGGGYGGADTGFRFALREVTRTANNRWFADFAANESTIKRELRQGGAETLNIYSLNMGDGLLGRATFPQHYRRSPKDDGVLIDYRTVPGGGRENFDLGHTATHEIGHWLGLFHTFQNGCANPGDYVPDTPYEREQSIGCPQGRDSCPRRSGEDPVHNFMNYSNDPCLHEFTRGQGERMGMAWAAFRG